jgi:hypothetical protein
MDVILYNTSSSDKCLSKNLTQVAQAQATIKGSCSIESPVLVLTYDTINFNYMYIPEWGRYYYTDPPTLSSGGQMFVSGHVDVLMTYKDYIKKLKVNVARAETGNMSNQIDSSVPIECQYTTDVIPIYNSVMTSSSFDTNSNVFVLNVTGGYTTDDT